MLKVKRRGAFSEMLNELTSQDESLKQVINRRIKWFQSNPQDTRLDNHPLIKTMAGKWAFSITGDIRIVYEWLSKNTVRFLAIGGHKRVYKKRSG